MFGPGNFVFIIGPEGSFGKKLPEKYLNCYFRKFLFLKTIMLLNIYKNKLYFIIIYRSIIKIILLNIKNIYNFSF